MSHGSETEYKGGIGIIIWLLFILFIYFNLLQL